MITLPIANDNLTVFITDNGAAYCGAHLGVTARMTGCDLSGQPIMAVVGAVLQEAKASGWIPECETCGARADDRETFARAIAGVATRPLSDILVPAPRRKVRATMRGPVS